VIAVASDRMRKAGRRLAIQGASHRQERSMRRRGLLIPPPRTPESGRPQRAGSGTASPAGSLPVGWPAEP
jgi:hypothetical protein